MDPGPSHHVVGEDVSLVELCEAHSDFDGPEQFDGSLGAMPSRSLRFNAFDVSDGLAVWVLIPGAVAVGSSRCSFAADARFLAKPAEIHCLRIFARRIHRVVVRSKDS
ncbi:hypothetical protein GUJ93_ZPchr0010g9733 [Zizania palustris]|uniref:Uncharacterized protein n=1 Tax=Zizania palustris TaxID=103762 RepID=A0A8J5W7W2_ZIZPA|nr:hypothetical protein GUJ93_ZPchr0010g9733 [Zizania palustris]